MLRLLADCKVAAKAYIARKVESPEMMASLRRLSRNGFRPKHIFDVGAYQGEFTRLSLGVWPNARVVAFEVLEPKVEVLRGLRASGVAVDVITSLLGSENRGSVPFHEMDTASSVLDEHFPQQAPVRNHPMHMLDHIVTQYGVQPDLVKLDVQGYELEVLKGAEQTLKGVQVIVAELNLLDIHKGVPLLSEVLAWLDQRGWVAYDICGITRRPFDTALWQTDFVFVPRDSPLRSDKRWS
jgi:FkbM family methyltransferase